MKSSQLNLKTLANMIDISTVTATNPLQDIYEMVQAAKKYQFIAVSSLSCYIDLIREMLGENSRILILGPVGFPSGGEKTSIKVYEAEDALKSGCGELDMVMNIGLLKSQKYKEVTQDIKAVRDVAKDVKLKVIIEAPYLTNDEIKHACDCIIDAGADFVKTGTGWAPTPTTMDHVKLIKSHIGDALLFKVAGGVRTLDTVIEMTDAGVDRFGISKNASIKIMQEAQDRGWK